MQGARKKILLLDDGEFYRVLLTLILQEEGYESFFFESKSEGYDWLKANQPDLIISEADSPGLNSFEFIQLLKTDVRFKETPIILLSDFLTQSVDTLREATSVGAFACIAKPFRVEDLLRRVREALREK